MLVLDRLLSSSRRLLRKPARLKLKQTRSSLSRKSVSTIGRERIDIEYSRMSLRQAKLVKQEQQAIDAQYEKKLKGAEVAQKMYIFLSVRSSYADIPNPFYSAQSTLTNKSRLKLLHRREEHLQDLFSISRSSILALAKDDGRYIQFLEGVIVQGFLQLMESNVTLLSRKKDARIVKQAADAAAKAYTEISGQEVQFEIESSLSDEG
jgi:V-type H+-transporting ATPase subunit E